MSPVDTPAGLTRPSEQQAGFLLLQRLLPEVGLANMAWVFTCAEDFRAEWFTASLDWLVRRHPALRTVFPATAEGDLRRTITADEADPVRLDTFTGTADERVPLIRDYRNRPFDLSEELPLRAAMMSTSDGTPPTLVLVVHHIAVDAAASNLLVAELDGCYRSLREGGGLPPEVVVEPVVPPPVVTPAESLRYWQRHLEGVDPRRLVLRGYQRETEPRTFAARSDAFTAEPQTLDALRTLTDRLHRTRNMVLLAAFYALLATAGAGPDLTVGTPVRWLDKAGDPDERDGLGYHSRLLALRVRADPDLTFREFTLAVSRAMLEGMAHADVAYDQVVSTLTTVRPGEWRVPVFRQIFNYLPETISVGPHDSGLSFGRYVEVGKSLIRYELEFIASEAGEDLTFAVSYASELFDSTTIADLVARYEQILVAAAEDSDVRLARL